MALREAERILKERSRRDHLREAERVRLEQSSGDPDLRLVVDYYTERKLRGEKAVGHHHARKIDRVLAIIELKFGGFKPASSFGPWFVEKYVRLRTQSRIDFPPQTGRPRCGKVKTRTAISELKDFGSVLQFAVKEGVLRANPLAGYRWGDWLVGDEHAVEHMEEAHTRRYQLLLAPPKLTDPATGERLQAPINRISAVDCGARARASLAFLFHHGHRWVSVQSLMCDDIALDYDQTCELLENAPNHRRWWAAHFRMAECYGGAQKRRTFGLHR